MFQQLFTPGEDPVPIVQEAGWAPGPVWTGAEILAPTGIRSPDRPAHSQSDSKKSHHNNKPCVKEVVNVHSKRGLQIFVPLSAVHSCSSHLTKSECSYCHGNLHIGMFIGDVKY